MIGYEAFEYFVCRPFEDRFYKTGSEEDRTKVLETRKKVAEFWKKANRVVPARVTFV